MRKYATVKSIRFDEELLAKVAAYNIDLAPICRKAAKAAVEDAEKKAHKKGKK